MILLLGWHILMNFEYLQAEKFQLKLHFWVPALVLNLVALGLLTFVPVGPELGPAIDRILRIFLSLLVVRHLVTGRSATRPAQQAEGPTTRAELNAWYPEVENPEENAGIAILKAMDPAVLVKILRQNSLAPRICVVLCLRPASPQTKTARIVSFSSAMTACRTWTKTIPFGAAL